MTCHASGAGRVRCERLCGLAGRVVCVPKRGAVYIINKYIYVYIYIYIYIYVLTFIFIFCIIYTAVIYIYIYKKCNMNIYIYIVCKNRLSKSYGATV